jgi:hypothetical protein
MLEDLWNKQKVFTEFVLNTLDTPIEKLTDEDRTRLTKEYIEYLHSELVEVLNNTPWKKHRYTGVADRRALVEELVDVQKFLWGLMQIWGVSLDELTTAFNEKSTVVEQRFNQEHILPKLFNNVVLVDIDNVLADWDEGFGKWAALQGGHTIGEYEKGTALREIYKDKFRQFGLMLDLPVKRGAREGVELLVKREYIPVYLTARPINKHPRLINDTVMWLQANGFQHKYIYYTDINKHLFALENFKKVDALFDDDEQIVIKAKRAGYKAYRVHASYTLLDKVQEFLNETTTDYI